MFDFIRTHQRLMQLILLVLILPSFVLIGVSGYSTYVSGDHDLVKVGDSNITLQEFDQARRRQLEQAQGMAQGDFDPSALENPFVRSALLESLIDRRVQIDVATEQRFSVSDNALREAIASLPQLQEDGQFSLARYDQLLSSIGLTTRDFEQSQRAELAIGRVLDPVIQSASIPNVVLEGLRTALTEERDVRLALYQAADYRKDVRVSDEDAQAWYEQNKESLSLPEQVGIQYLLLNEQAAMGNLPAIDEQALRDYYDQNKSRYVQPARVNVSHIQVSVPPGADEEQRRAAQAKAEKLAAEAKADPAGFADLAKAQSEDAGTSGGGGTLGWITKGSWPAEVEEVVFALSSQEVSPAVPGPGGYHVFIANEVQPEQGESFEQARSKVELEVRRQLGAERFADMATQLTGLVYDNPSSLQPAADALGLALKTATGVTRDGLLPADQVEGDAASASDDAAVLDDPRLRRAVFMPQSYTEKRNTGIVEISPDTMIVARIDAVTPAQVPPFERVEKTVKDQLLQERAAKAAKEAGEKALAAFQRPDASEAGLGDVQTISRIDTHGLIKPVLDAAFNISADTALPAYTGVDLPQGYVVIRLDAVKPGNPDDDRLAGLGDQLAQSWGMAEQRAVLQALRTQAQVKLLPEAQKAIDGDLESE
ncbi:MAG: SurA N-terminal domain-containing protein [Candidimonas sp.]